MRQSTFHSVTPNGKARLKMPRGLCGRIRGAYEALRSIPREDVSPAGIWIEDNALFLLETADALGRELRFSPALPAMNGVPRVLFLARTICAGEEALSAARIVRAGLDWIGEEQFTQAEIDLLRPALCCALLEMLDARLTLCHRDREARRLARDWALRFSQGASRQTPRDPQLLSLFLSELSRREDTEGLRLADDLLAARGISAGEAQRSAQTEAAAEGLAVGNIIAFLRLLPALPMNRVSERLSPAAKALRQDPTYGRMDDESRAYYRKCACRAARRFRVRESAAALAAVALAEGKTGVEGEAGYYLIERPDLIGQYLLKRKKPSFARKHRPALFLAPLYGGAALALLAGALLGVPWYLWPLLPLCASEIVRLLLYKALRVFFPPRMLPRLRVARLGPETRTLIVTPTLLTSRKQAIKAVKHLAVLQKAHPDACLDFLLLADFEDSAHETMPEDEEITAAARLAIEEMNRARGGGFYYLHRARKWDMGQRAFTGRERKRGALESLNRLLTEGKTRDAFVCATAKDAFWKDRYAYVITLDGDTFMPAGGVHSLVGAMEHPLQKGRVGVIQPRMETAPSAVRTRIQKLWGGCGGADPYHLSVQDVYQDVFGQGSFVGKGIYAPAFWRQAIQGRLPAGRLLSHDLIEGETVGSALAEDIVLFDGHPATVEGWRKRLHRWTRGDWQLLPFLWDKRLSLLSRHKIWDNLRRSLVPAAQTLLLLFGAGLRSPLLCLLALPWPLSGMLRRLPALPGKACTLLDGIVRALYRQFVSHRNLLSWVTAAQTEQSGGLSLSCLMAQLAAGGALTALSLFGGYWPAAFAGLIWVTAPLLIPFFNGPTGRPRPLSDRQTAYLRLLARDTWRFFEDAVNESTHFLPPDNVQTDPDKGPALRTSPTNMGLYLLSCCAAREMKLIGLQELADRLDKAVRTMESLETWKGHFYNWYSLDSLSPLTPRFVSTVDSGNCMGCLLCCAQLLRRQGALLPETAQNLPARLDALAMRMDFSALYDKKRHLFSVGWDADARRLSPAHYDCLASEARLTSFLAVMTGQAERRHWRYLSRAAVLAGGGPALLSWGGTMFEYLMPALLLPLAPGTLLGEGCRSAVRAQMANDPGRPFGISESGYYAFDPDLNYQYRAFGLPVLAKSPDTRGEVIAPYASALALPLFPRAAEENLRRMDRLGWHSAWGFYEAADYAPQRIGAGPRIVKSHMAHHQGMILCALCNALENDVLVRAFMALPAARAHEDLLWERAPGKAHRRVMLPSRRQETPPETPAARPALPGLPLEAAALYGGGTVWVLTAQGQGSLSAGDTQLTRFDAQAGAQTGPQFYMRDLKDGVWTRLMTGGAVFGEGMARYRLAWRGLEVVTRCCVDPLTGAAVTLVSLKNLSGQERDVEAVSFLEIAQGSREADEAHPNFRDLGVRVSPWGSHGLIARRLARDEKDVCPLIGHFAAGDGLSLRRQGDRTLFLGRTGSYAAPEQMGLPAEDCAYRLGDVTAPCLSLRVRVRISAQGQAAVCFFTAVRDTEEALNALPRTESRARTAFSLAAAQEKMILRSLAMAGDMPGMYRQILGALYFFDQPHQQRFPSAPFGTLWEIGVSGALPVWLILLDEGNHPALVGHALKAHAWMRARGVKTDLVFFGPEEKEYFRPVRDKTLQMIASSPSRGLLGQPGGVFWTEGNETRFQALSSLSRLTLRSGQSLKAQLSALRQTLPAPAEQALSLPEPAPAPPLRHWNAFGGFTETGGYCVQCPPPAPWHQLLCNPLFGTLVCESGILHSYALNSRLGRITRLCPDVRRGVPSEEIYLLDGAGKVWPLVRCAALYEPGGAVYRCRAGKAEAETTVFAHAERPLTVRSVTLRAGEESEYTLCWLVRFALGEHPAATRCRAEQGFVWAQSGGMAGVAWAGLPDAECQALCAASCFGLTGGDVPAALLGPARGVGSVGLLRLSVTMKPRETLRLTLALGWAENESAARADASALLAEGAAQAERNTRAFWARRLAGLQLFSLHETLNDMMNLWLPYQVISARLWARMGPYQTGGAIGFRDQLQDCLALLHTDPAFVRAHLMLCAAHQYEAGDVQHWWHPPRRGVRTRISDDRLFLPYLTAQYVTVTGDAGVLEEEAPYLLSAPLSPEETDRYEEPEVSAWGETLLSHCLRAVDSVSLGVHGLPLMGGGDWNDGMNRVGGRTGESVWLGFFLALTLKALSPFCSPDKKESLLQLRRKLLDSAESAWTGSWYLRAWRDGGEPMGGPDTKPPRIDLISQCFAALAGAPRDHARTALIHAVNLLWDREAGLVRLLDPPFTPEENAGYIGGYLPGVRENGGQYTHAVPWLIMALCRMGEYALAWDIAKGVLPAAHADTREKALIYKIEPYVLAGDVYAGENRGMGGWSWYTGSAAWYWWAVLTELMGFEKRGNKARLSPHWDEDGEGFTLTYRFGSANYHFTASRDAVFPTLDGEKLTDGWAELKNDGRTHEARYPLRALSAT